jgi:hypothetical protein
MENTNNNKPQWMIDFENTESNSEKKETAYGSWSDFEKETGMTKEQYMKRENKIAEELAELEVNCCICK